MHTYSDHNINKCTHTHTHTHSVITAIFPGEHGLGSCPLILLIHLFLDCASFWDRPKLSTSFLTQSHQIFFGHPLCLILSTPHVIQRLTQSLSSFCSTCPNHLDLLFLIIKLTGSNPKSSRSSSLFFFFLSFSLTPHPSDHTHFSAIHLHFMLNFHRPGLTAMHQTTPHTSSIYLAFQFLTRILFQLEWIGIHETFSKQI